MKTNLEIEFKTYIDEAKYLELLSSLNLKDNVFTQVNYYFDTNNLEIIKNKDVLRIRQKGKNYKLTYKAYNEKETFESHILLSESEAQEMINHGFDANIIGLDLFVRLAASLKTERVSTPYKEGLLFLDKSFYYDTVDYEIEYEVDNYDSGLNAFEELIEEYNINFKPSQSKSYRAYKKNPSTANKL